MSKLKQWIARRLELQEPLLNKDSVDAWVEAVEVEASARPHGDENLRSVVL